MRLVVNDNPGDMRRCAAHNFTFCYQHKGIKPGQADFDGTMALIIDFKGRRLQGKYYTNRPSPTDGSVGSNGHVILYQLSDNSLSTEEALKTFIEDEKLLSRAVLEVADMAGRDKRDEDKVLTSAGMAASSGTE